jgi:stringent starvation protein B
MASRHMTTRQRPYLIRAMHEWMVDNGLTPHIVADATREGLVVPAEHVTDGKIILNVSHEATRGLSLGNEEIEFEARFAGTPHRLTVPVAAVLGIYARETGQGMIFSDEDSEPPPDGPEPSDASSTRPNLKVVK